MMHRLILLLLIALLPSCDGAAPSPGPVDPALAPIDTFFDLRVGDYPLFLRSLARLEDPWDDRYVIMLAETAGVMHNDKRVGEIAAVLARRTSAPWTEDLEAYHAWVWEDDPGMHPEYPQFKARLYELIDERFRPYFEQAGATDRIRLDEIRWGGVARDGIPPLKNPPMIPADEAMYLDPDNVVFGLEINGDARRYPKRILAWHELFEDRVGGVAFTGVYCTLCGSMILYESTHAGRLHELGTSGFLYRSNKLMYDHATESLWSTMTGRPVIGPLAGEPIALTPRAVVTTTWAEWRRAHPQTTVLALETGFRRDYREGAAYRAYFATDDLMFGVPQLDTRLANKAEVLALRFGDPGTDAAIPASVLAEAPIFHGTKDGEDYVVLTDESGANRVYATDGLRFSAYDAAEGIARDTTGAEWAVREDAMTNGPRTLDRLPAHRAFWFGWFAAHPDTMLFDQERPATP